MNPPWFDENYYLAAKLAQLTQSGQQYTLNQVRAAMTQGGSTPYDHYVAYGDKEQLSPNAWLSRAEYIAAKVHQLNRTKHEGKTTWTADEVAKSIEDAGMTAGEHFAMAGWMENVNPSNEFDVSNYMDAKLASVQRMPGSDASGKPWASYEFPDLVEAFAAQGVDPLSHYMLLGVTEGLRATPVPEGERVEADPTRPRSPVLGSDGKTITVHFTSKIVADSLEVEDFSVMLNGVARKVATAEVDTEAAPYDLVITLADDARVAGLVKGSKDEVRVVYNPDGGETAQLELESGPVRPFDEVVENLSHCFNVVERYEESTQEGSTILIRSLKISLTPPLDYVESNELTAFVKVDLTVVSEDGRVGVTTGGEYGLVTTPRLTDGSKVNSLDTTAVDRRVHLDIVAGEAGGEITTGDGADNLTLGGGKDIIHFKTLTNSQISHMDTVNDFTYGVSGGESGGASGGESGGGVTDVSDKLLFPKETVTKVIYKGPLSLAGDLSQAAVQGVFGAEKMAADTAYLLKNGTDYALVIDSNADGVFTGSADFALSLIGLTGLPEDLNAGDELPLMLG